MYSRFIDFGSSTNKKVMFPEEPSNPLTYCLWDNSNSNYVHGASAFNYKPFCVECSTFMKEIGNGMHGYGPWGTLNINGKLQSYCEFYLQNNQENTRPNLSAINNEAFKIANCMMKEKNTVGENLLRNTLELRFLNYLTSCESNDKISFNPNVASSPFIKIHDNVSGSCPVIINIPAEIDNDIIMNRALLSPNGCMDVFAYIWAAFANVMPNKVMLNYPCNSLNDNEVSNQNYEGLKNTKIGKYLLEKSDYYSNVFLAIQKGLRVGGNSSSYNNCACKQQPCNF